MTGQKETKGTKRTGESGLNADIAVIYRQMQQPDYIVLNQCALKTVAFQLSIIDMQLSDETGRSVIQSIQSRIKSPESAIHKLQQKGYDPTWDNVKAKLRDLAGIRAVCSYVDDVYLVGEFLKKQRDIRILKEKDYIKTPKSTGYRSLHYIAEVPVFSRFGYRFCQVEIQMRTSGMDFWASLEHEMIYKKERKGLEEAERGMRECAAALKEIEDRMIGLRDQIYGAS